MKVAIISFNFSKIVHGKDTVLFEYTRIIPLCFFPWPFNIKICIPQVENTKSSFCDYKSVAFQQGSTSTHPQNRPTITKPYSSSMEDETG